MGFYITYRNAEGKTVNENFGSYYLAVVRKKDLTKKGIESKINEKKQFYVSKTPTNSVSSAAEREMAKKTFKEYQISSEYKQKLNKSDRKGRTNNEKESHKNRPTI